jgi:peptide/nickel transport system substrate-binding protein
MLRRPSGRRRLYALTAPLLFTLLVSCAPAPTARTNDGGAAGPSATPKTLRIAMQTSNEQASPAMWGGSGSGSAALEHYFIFHSNLTVFDSQKNVTARLAQKVPTVEDGDWKVLPDGGMEVTWKIRPDVKWHDGTALTAEDFAFGFQVMKDKDLAIETRGDLDKMSDVRVVDPQTMTIIWKGQSVYGNANGHDGIPAIPRHIFKPLYDAGDKAGFENSALWNTGWVGLGPFKLTSWNLGSQMEAAAFDHYALGRPKVDRLIIRYIGDVNALVANVLSGDIDLIPAGAQLDINQMVTMRQAWSGNNAGTTLLNTKSVRTMYLQLRDPAVPWNDIRVRQALLYGMNRDEIVESLLFGLVPRADFYAPPEEPVMQLAQQRNLPKYPFDLQRAERLLSEVGWTRGADRQFHDASGQTFHFDVMASGQGDNVTEATTVAGQWTQSGFESKPTPYPANAENAAEIRHNMPNGLIWPWNFSVSDLRTVATSETGTAANRWRGGNYGGYSNKNYDALYDQFASELNASKRTENYFQMIKVLAEELPVLPLFYRATGLAARKGVEGPTPTPPIQAGSAWNVHQWTVS